MNRFIKSAIYLLSSTTWINDCNVSPNYIEIQERHLTRPYPLYLQHRNKLFSLYVQDFWFIINFK